MNSYQSKAELSKKEQLGPDIYRFTLKAYDIALAAQPGQFVMVKVTDGLDPLLRRPFSIHQVTGKGELQILFKAIGKGTEILANLPVGSTVDLVGPLGNSFSLPEQGLVCLVGGGMGIAPLLFLSKKLLQRKEPPQIRVLLGAQHKGELTQLLMDFEGMGVQVDHATDDGSSGHKGFVTELIEPIWQGAGDQQCTVLCCGPTPMMKAVAGLCHRNKVQCQVSLETMMACGISACLGCTVLRSKQGGHNPDALYFHVCKDGPVFDAGVIEW